MPCGTSWSRPSASRQVHPLPSEGHGHRDRNAAHCPGLTARARPEARPGTTRRTSASFKDRLSEHTNVVGRIGILGSPLVKHADRRRHARPIGSSAYALLHQARRFVVVTGITHSGHRVLPACGCLVRLPQALVGQAEVGQGLALWNPRR